MRRAPVLVGDLAGKLERALPQRPPAEKDHGRLARAQHARGLRDGLASRRGVGCGDARAPRDGPEPSFHAVSAGRIRVATWPGGVRAAAIAAAPSAATDLASGEVRTQDETVFAAALDVGGERRVVAAMIGRVVADDVDHRRRAPCGRCADWRGRWRGRARDAATSRPACRSSGHSRRRRPVTTPSNRPRMQRIPSTRSSAATKCISDVPGLAKHTLTPPPTSVRTRLSAPFTTAPAHS